MNRTKECGVTVLLPVYNGEAFLSEQIETILNQTCADLRLVIWDDCSSDTSHAISKEFERRDCRVSVHENARNIGLVRTIGHLLSTVETPFFALSDQDDLWDADKLQVSIDAMHESGAVLAYSDVRTCDAGGRVLAPSYWESRALAPLLPVGPPLLSIFRNPVLGHTIVARREVAEHLNDPPPELTFYEPWLLASANHVGMTCYVRRPLGSYRVHQTNVVGPAPVTRLARLNKLRKLDLADRQSTRYQALLAVGAFSPQVANLARGFNSSVYGRLRATTQLYSLLSECAPTLTRRQRYRECLLLLFRRPGRQAHG